MTVNDSYSIDFLLTNWRFSVRKSRTEMSSFLIKKLAPPRIPVLL